MPKYKMYIDSQKTCFENISILFLGKSAYCLDGEIYRLCYHCNNFIYVHYGFSNSQGCNSRLETYN